jgi:hypothetical protein
VLVGAVDIIDNNIISDIISLINSEKNKNKKNKKEIK